MRRLVDFIPLANGLKIVLLPAGWTELGERVEEHGEECLNPDSALYDVAEHQLCNGWEMVPPEDVGALTSAPLFSRDTERDDDGKLVRVGRVYAYMDYQVKAPVRELWEQGEIVLTAHD